MNVQNSVFVLLSFVVVDCSCAKVNVNDFLDVLTSVNLLAK